MPAPRPPSSRFTPGGFVIGGPWDILHSRLPRSNASGILDCGKTASASPPRPSLSVSPELTEAARHHILELADHCSLLSDHMQLLAQAHGGRVSRQDPAFAVLVEDFAAVFMLLTAAVDELQEAGLPWECHIADSRLLKALRAGLAGWEEHRRATNAGVAPAGDAPAGVAPAGDAR